MRTRRFQLGMTVAAAALAAALAIPPTAAWATAGDVDTGFGTNGWTQVPPLGATSVNAGGLVRRDDGVLIVGANDAGADFQTVAFTKGGDPLAGYGTGGVGSVTIPNASSAAVTDTALQANGRVVVAGYVYSNTGSDRFGVARFRLGGAPDPTFSGDGLFTTRFPSGDAYGYGVAIQPDGRIVVVGEVDPASGVSNVAAIRLMPDGRLDKSFGVKGRRVIKLPDGVKGYDGAWRVAIGGRGNIIMGGWEERSPAGSGNYKTLAIRLRPGGALDHTFSGDGIAMVDADGTDNWAYAMGLDGGKVVLGLHTSSDEAGFLRLLANGHRDTTFGGDGFSSHPLSTAWEVGALVVMANHKIVGVNDDASGPNLVRLRANGTLDSGTFGLGGEAVGPLTNAHGYGLTILPNGKIVAAGTVSVDVFVARFLGA